MKTRFVLASTSPRRIDLLRAAGIACTTASPECDETPLRGESPRALVRRLARAKAESVAGSHLPGGNERVITVAADTIVVEPSRKKILGKPSDPEDARRMLKLICGRTHEVLTGYCVIERTRAGVRRAVKIVSTRVTMLPLDAAQIRAYVATGEPMDKAGSYAAQGLGMNFIESIRGSYTNVVGLPMAQFLETLDRDFDFRVMR